MGRKLSEVLRGLPKARREAINRNAEKIANEMIEYSLRELRESANRTQLEVARVLEVPQNAVSQLESRQDMRVSTVERYVAALGGTLSLVVDLGEGKRCLLRRDGEFRGPIEANIQSPKGNVRAASGRRRLKGSKG